MGCSCSNTFNVTKIQVPDEAKEMILKSGNKIADSLGTGLFVVADPEKGSMEVKKIAIHDIGLKEASMRAMACIAAKWVPYEMLAKTDMAALLLPADGCDSDECGSIIIQSNGVRASGGCTSGNCVCIEFPGQACA